MGCNKGCRESAEPHCEGDGAAAEGQGSKPVERSFIPAGLCAQAGSFPPGLLQLLFAFVVIVVVVGPLAFVVIVMVVGPHARVRADDAGPAVLLLLSSLLL